MHAHLLIHHLTERVLSPRSSVSSLSSGSTTSSMPSQGSANLAEVRSAVAAHRGSSSSVEYVPSASYAQSGSSSTTPGTSPPSAVGTDALSLRRSYHEKQHSDSARSLEHALMKASPSSSSPPPPTASISRKTSLSTSPSSHSRSTSASSPVHTPLTAALDANALSNVPNRPGLVTTATSPTLPVKAGASQSDAIRLQRVPTSVRIAQSLHPMLTPTTVSAASVSSTSHLTPVQHAEVSPLQTSPQPRTPLASRANTPSSDTSSSSLSAPASKTPSRHGSPAQDPKGTRLPPLHMTATPTTASATSSSHRTNSSPSASAYSPLFDIPTMASPARRARARTFSIPSAAVLREPSMRTSIENTGRPPPSQGLLLEFDAQPHQSPRETSAGSVSKQSHRLSAQPILHGTLPTEDEYARIIMQSRSAKMKKWKGTSKTGLDANTDFAPFHDNGGASSSLSAPRSGHVKRGNMAFDEDAPFQDPQEADIADQERGSDLLSDFGHHGDMTRHSSSTSASNVEWVDWLDEYRKMKEAKVLAESQNAGSVDDQSVIPGEAESESRWPSCVTSIVDLHSAPATVIANYAFPPPVASPAGRLHSQSNVDLTSNTPSLQRTTSHVEPGHHSMATVMQSDPPHQKRKRASGAFSRIDAWWGSVRNSFGGHSPSTSQNNVFRQAPSSTFALPEPMSPKTTASYQPRHLPQETEREAADKSAMPPPPIPLKKPKPTTSTSEPIVMQAKGALAPAARITTAAGRPPLGNRSISSQSFDSSASEEILPPQLPPIAKRRNLRLSLSLGTQRPPSNSDNSRPSSHSSTSSGQPQHGRPTPMQTPSAMPRPSIFGRETTPGLTPGHSPVWDKTPGLVPSRNTGVDASHPVRPPLGRGTSGATPSASFSILTVRQHIRHRLQTAKESCDRELRKIIQGITAYVDKELIKERASALDLASDSAVEPESDQEEAFGTSTAASASNSPGQRHASLSAVGPSQLFGSSPGSSSPLVRRKSSVAAKKGRSRRSEHTGTSPQRQHRKGERGYSGLAPQASDITAALNRSLSSRSNDSNPTSRSTSRSHSPLPGSEAPYRRASGHITPARLDTHEATPLVSTLQAVITIATEILDTSVASLIAKPGSCSEFIHRVQSIGKAWDENAWPCRGWYVQLLLAVAGLSRVVEWWEAEKGFWKFDDEPESGDNEPIV